MATTAEIAPDHRTRVAAEKRERMHRRLVESAMLVFAEKGVDASVIDDVLVAAEVSRGTFYHYFRTNAELLAATSEAIDNELLTAIEARVGALADPAERIACGIRLYFHTARRYPLLARFLSRAGFDVNSPRNRFYAYLPRHVQEGMQSGQFCAMQAEVALDLIAGTCLLALFRLSAGTSATDYPEQVVAAILRGLGVQATHLARLLAIPLQPLLLPPDALLERSHARFVQA